MYYKYLLYIFILQNCVLYSTNPISNNNSQKNDSLKYYTKRTIKAGKQLFNFPENSFQILKENFNYFKKHGYTDDAVKCLYIMSDIQKSRGKSGQAFELLWEAIYIMEPTNNYAKKAIIHRKISYLYDDFNKPEESKFHLLKSILVSKKLAFENKNERNQLNSGYLNLAIREKKSGNYHKALKYLDSIIISDNEKNSLSYAAIASQIERGNLYTEQKKYQEASSILHSVNAKNDENNLSHKARIYFSLGELKLNSKQLDSSIYYYKKSLKAVGNNNFYQNYTPIIFNRLSEIYHLKKQPRLAYKYLSKKNIITDSLAFHKNKVYSDLFEIKNTYLESIREKDFLIEEKNDIIQKNEQTQFRLKIILILVLISGLALVFYSRLRLKLKKTLLEKKESELQSELSKEKSEAEIQLKSKELTSYALQLIDKDRAIDELLEKIKENAPSSYKSLSNKYKKGAEDLWKQFNLRFTEVNSDFYKRLKEKHPTFTRTEQKHLALIKLKFSTKEMARILNIEPHSVHISRSRIRKKIGLERSESLENYINEI
jgi:tetratricopeptide (TPR) repeat protein